MKVLDSLYAEIVGGWFIGDFEPSAYRTRDFEVCYKIHPKGEKWPTHYHEHSIEINYLMHGKMTINNVLLEAPVIFILEKGEPAKPGFLEDCELIVVRVPSIPDDKIIVEGELE